MSPATYTATALSEIDAIHESLRKGFRSGKTKSIPFRKQQLLQLCYMLDDNKDRFHDALASDLGRSTTENNLLEMGGSLAEVKLAHSKVEKWSKPEATPFQLNYMLAKPTVRKEPKGVVLIIVPFNYPLWLTFSPLAGAIAAGNAVVVKPSELIPATSALFEELFAKYLDPSVYRIVNGAVPETTHLLSLPWDHILYTGNGRVGRIVATAAAKHLTPVTLELGGKSPVFIDPNCDMKSAAHRILWAKTANAGQTCVAPDYVLVPKEAVDGFVQELKTAYAEFYPEGPQNSKSYSRIVTSNHFERLKGVLNRTSGTVVVGGQVDASTKFIAPTIVKDVSGDDSLMSDELFGPILPIVSVKDVDEAIQFVSDRDHPLAIYVFSQDPGFKQKVIENTQSGSAIVNDCLIHCVVDGLPFGGIGPSGSGGYHTGKYSFDMFTHLRGTMDNPGWLDVIMKFRFPPLSEAKDARIKMATFPSLPSRTGVIVRTST